VRALRIATRGSRLALVQARAVAGDLRRAHPGLSVEEVVIRTTGDRDRRTDLADLSRSAGVGFFVREVEGALRDGRADLAVHSLKDLPTEQRDGLVLAAVPVRQDPRDALAPPLEGKEGEADPLAVLPPGARVGTGSPRRRAQVLARRPDLEVLPLRGNVPTRLAKAGPGGKFDAVVLAAAGLVRLGLEGAALPLDPGVLLPAPGQGALGLQCREDDEEVLSLLAALDDRAARAATDAERAFLHRLEGGCALPAAALAEVEDGRLRLQALVAEPEGREVLREERTAPAGESGAPEALGRAVAERLLERGAASLLGGRA